MLAAILWKAMHLQPLTLGVGTKYLTNDIN